MSKILVLDDDDQIRESVALHLQRSGYATAVAAGVAEARLRLKEEEFHLILCDINLGGESGLDFLRQVAAELPDTAVVMMTGVDDPEVAREAINMGAYGYIVKPFHPNELLIQVTNGLHRREAERQRREVIEELEAKVLDRTSSLRTVMKRLDEAESAATVSTLETVERLASALTLRSEETGRHIERVGHYAALLQELLGITVWLTEELRLAAMLHDVGKIGIPDPILLKPGKLTHDEFEVVKRHTEMGHRLLSDGHSPMMRLGATIALTHHENWNGSGYPGGLSGDDIPLEGRIVAVADSFDALTSDRVYRPARSVEVAQEELLRSRGGRFEPALVDLFVDAMDAVVTIKDRFPDLSPLPEIVRVLVVDDHQMFAESLERLIDAMDGMVVTGTVGTVAEARAEAMLTDPDVALVDWMLPDGTGADVARMLREVKPECKTILLTGLSEESIAAAAVEAGCSGYLTKHKAGDELAAAIRAVYRGESLIPPSLVTSVLTRLRPERRRVGSLTNREIEVLEMLSSGQTNEAIAAQLVLSLNTVRNHVQNILSKLDTHSKLEAVAAAVKQGIIQFQR
jgi:putative two-component system response regulator